MNENLMSYPVFWQICFYNINQYLEINTDKMINVQMVQNYTSYLPVNVQNYGVLIDETYPPDLYLNNKEFFKFNQYNYQQNLPVVTGNDAFSRVFCEIAYSDYQNIMKVFDTMLAYLLKFKLLQSFYLFRLFVQQMLKLVVQEQFNKFTLVIPTYLQNNPKNASALTQMVAVYLQDLTNDITLLSEG